MSTNSSNPKGEKSQDTGGTGQEEFPDLPEGMKEAEKDSLAARLKKIRTTKPK